MAGLGEILGENTRLREILQAQEALIHDKDERLQVQDERLQVQGEQLQVQGEQLQVQGEQVELLRKVLEAVQASNDELAKRLAYIEEKAKRAKNERYRTEEQEHFSFGDDIELPPRDPAIQEADEAKATQTDDEAKAEKEKRRSRHGRRKARDDKTHPHRNVTCPVAPAKCPCCGEPLVVFSTTSSSRMNWVVGHFEVLDVEREQCRCTTCPQAGTYAAPDPFFLPRSLCADGLLARVIIDKAADHIPLNRQVARMARGGFTVSTSTLSGWYAQGAEQVQLLVSAVEQQVVTDDQLLGDDTGLPVQDGTDGKLRTGRLWVFTDQQQAFYRFTETKQGTHPAALLAGLGVIGRILLDGGSEFNKAVRDLGLERAGCWSHLRRYFFDAKLQHHEAHVAVVAIHDLFMIERELADMTAAQRKEERQRRSKPIVDGFFEWAKQMSTSARPKSLLGKALTYARNQEPYMRKFLEHGELPIHNNLSELMLRQPIVGRKNWLFAGSAGGAKAATAWYTLIGSCMLQALDPFAYLVDIFHRLPQHPANRVHELTPKNWRAAAEAGQLQPISQVPSG